jgi:hypothetical protein
LRDGIDIDSAAGRRSGGRASCSGA